MDPNTFPTKGNLILAKNSLKLAHMGYELMDKKRNILIRELMGFSSPSYFSQCFRKAEGMTPNEYRRQTRQGKRPAPTKRHEV